MCSHDANISSSVIVRTVRGAPAMNFLHHANMARKTKQVSTSAPGADWFLQEWMAALRKSQADLARECDWTRGTMHGIYHGRTDYYRELVNLIASKLNIQPYELLMHPDDAMAIRQLRRDALRVVEHGRRLDEAGTSTVRLVGS